MFENINMIIQNDLDTIASQELIHTKNDRHSLETIVILNLNII